MPRVPPLFDAFDWSFGKTISGYFKGILVASGFWREWKVSWWWWCRPRYRIPHTLSGFHTVGTEGLPPVWSSWWPRWRVCRVVIFANRRCGLNLWIRKLKIEGEEFDQTMYFYRNIFRIDLKKPWRKEYRYHEPRGTNYHMHPWRRRIRTPKRERKVTEQASKDACSGSMERNRIRCELPSSTRVCLINRLEKFRDCLYSINLLKSFSPNPQFLLFCKHSLVSFTGHRIRGSY